MTVYDVLFPLENKYKGMVHLAVMDNRKELKSLGYCYFEDLPNRIKNLDIMQSRNYYITANATKQYTKRCSDNLFSLNNIVLDFDIHSRMNQAYRDDLIEDFVWRIKRDLFDIIAPFNIPKPNVIHYTGRGVQLWWHIDSASSQLVFLYRIVIDHCYYDGIKIHIFDIRKDELGCGGAGELEDIIEGRLVHQSFIQAFEQKYFSINKGI